LTRIDSFGERGADNAVTGRPRPRHGGGTDDGGTPPPGRRPPGFGADDGDSIGRAQERIAEAARLARPSGNGAGAAAPHQSEVELSRVMRVYDRLGEQPPEFNIARNDAGYRDDGAHTLERHGPDLPLRRDPAGKTVEGRIYGDMGWGRPDNWSLRWTDHTTMHREINNYVRDNWDEIRTDLAMEGVHNGAFNAGHRVGEGFYNEGMYGVGPRQARYTAASLVRISIDIIPGTDPPQPFIVTAFPAGVVPPGLL
jgi:hypothetical protein